MKHIKNAVIVSGGNIDVDFALDFLKKIKRKEPFMIAADRGLEFFEKTGLVPDAAVGDFDSLSIEGQKFLDTLKNTEILRLKPEKDDSDTQSAACFAMDRGAEGAALTIRNLEEQQIGHSGLYLNEEDRDQTVIREVNGTRIAVLSWTYATNQPVDEPWRVNVFGDAWSSEVNTLLADVEQAKKQADCVIVCMHWGTEFTYSLNESQIQIGQMLADSGVDVIIGNHPHTIQPAEWIEAQDGHKTLCFYSLGNLISSAYTVSRADETFQNMYEVGALAQFELKKSEDGVQVLNPVIIPVVNHFEGEYENFRLMPLKDYTEELAARHSQADWSADFSASWLKNQVRQVFQVSGIPVELD